MGTVNWGGSVNSTQMYSYDVAYFYSNSAIGMPSCRLAANGNRPVRVGSVALTTIVDGQARISYSGTITSGGTTFGSSGGSFLIYAYRTGNRLSVGRNTGGPGRTYYSDGGYQSGIMPGSISYSEVPSQPLSPSAAPSGTVGGRIDLSWSAPSSNGGSSVTSYNIYRDGSYIGNVDDSVTTYADTGRTTGVSYSYTIRARNAVTDGASTQSVDSSSASATAPGLPTAPQNPVTTPSTSVTGRIVLTWDAPATTGTGGITGYNIFRGGTQIATTTGTGRTYTNSSLTPYTTYSYTVKARNAFADSNDTLSANSSSVSGVAPGPPGPPTSLTAAADAGTPGKIDLAWDAPAVTGTGGITGYKVYLSTNALIESIDGTGTTYSATGLNPGQTYTFYVVARNALSDNEGTQSSNSNTATEQALGEPDAPTDMAATASTVVPKRISLSWTAPGGTSTGYSVFEYNTSTEVDTLIAVVKTTSYVIDGLTAGAAKSYAVRARNSYTDSLGTGYPGNYGGERSATASATPVSDYSIPVGALTDALTDNTNVVFNGTYVINAVAPTTIRYAKTASNIAAAATSSGTVTNNTNTTLNGTYTISTPTANTFTYAKTASNIASSPVSGGTLTNDTNVSFNGTGIVVSSVNTVARTITYPRTGSAVSTAVVPVNAAPGAFGTVENTTNAIYNGSGLEITAATADTLSYSVTEDDQPESNAAGTVENTTNSVNYNGTYVVDSIPSHNVFTYTSDTPVTQAAVDVPTTPSGQVARESSPAQLDIKYRSGWAG